MKAILFVLLIGVFPQLSFADDTIALDFNSLLVSVNSSQKIVMLTNLSNRKTYNIYFPDAVSATNFGSALNSKKDNALLAGNTQFTLPANITELSRNLAVKGQAWSLNGDQVGLAAARRMLSSPLMPQPPTSASVASYNRRNAKPLSPYVQIKKYVAKSGHAAEPK